MQITSRLAGTVLLALTLALPMGAVAQDIPDNWDGLIRVKPKKVDAACLAPGADFRSYTKVILDPTEVAFRKNWLRDQNDSRRELSRKLTEEDATRMTERARTGFNDLFAKEFGKSGLQIVTTPGPDVLRLSTAVINLYLNAPDNMSAGMTRSYTMEAGEATMVIEARDSTTGALLGRAVDQRETQSTGRMSWTTSVSNQADFSMLFTQWAKIAIHGLEELKAHSPAPADLKPNQKL